MNTPSKESTKEPKLNDNSDHESLLQDLPKKQYNDAMAISYMLSLNPKINKEDEQMLMFTQVSDMDMPKRIMELYHLLDINNVPLHLINNTSVKAHLRDMKHLLEVQSDNESNEDSNEDSSDEMNDQDEMLRKAWIYYVKQQEKKKNKKRKHKVNSDVKSKQLKTQQMPLDTDLQKSAKTGKSVKSAKAGKSVDFQGSANSQKSQTVTTTHHIPSSKQSSDSGSKGKLDLDGWIHFL
jgi:hypothetical protein